MRKNPAFVLRNIYDKYILMPICANQTSTDPILLNEVAVSIWNAAGDKSNLQEVMKDIADSYGLLEDSPEMVAVQQFLGQMLQMGLILEEGEAGNDG